MDQFPVFLQLAHSRCLVVGGGVVAERKVRLLLRAGAAVTVAARDLTDELARLRDADRILHHKSGFTNRLLDRMTIVIAATDDGEVNCQVSRAAENAGILCNVVDNGDASSFIVPAIVDRSPVIVAIGTGGNAPVLAQRLKAQIEAWLPARIDALAMQAGRWRELVKKRFASVRERRRFWQRFFDGPIAEHLLANRRQQAERALRLELIENVVAHARPAGEAYIVGAGPGDPGLVTIRAQQLIGQADVVLYDRLVSEQILDFARKDAQMISVGKTAHRVTISQDEINKLMIAHVRRGRRVCRLKGGDPFVFGRGGEEIQALADAGLPYQVVPGISAALGAAAYAGIPLTQRGMSSCVTLATAELDDNQAPDWSALARPGQTLVLYMGVGSVAESAEQLVVNGLAAETPVAVVENATTARQRVLRGTLATIAGDAFAAQVRAPAVIIIGPTAGMGEALRWFTADPDASGTSDNQALSWQLESPIFNDSSLAQ